MKARLVQGNSLEHRADPKRPRFGIRPPSAWGIRVSAVSFLSRWVTGDYRRALAGGAAGDYPLAARLYAQCGESRKLAEMQLLQVGAQTAREEALGRRREAARWAHGESTLLRRAAQGIEREGRRDTPTVPPDGELLREAAA